MIIVEGMDGTGKTNLVARLKKDLGIPQAERASTSVGGPVPGVYEWAKYDVATWPERPVEIYDRHPFVSELIYGPITREKIDPEFFGLAGTRLRNLFWRDALVVFCDVPYDEVDRNLSGDHGVGQMPGVREHAFRLWAMYRTVISTAAMNPAAHIVTWNYTRQMSGGYASILAAGERHVQEWKND